MPRNPSNETIECPYFRWIVYKVGGIYYADGRSKSLNGVNLGRHSLGCKEKSDVESILLRLDAKIAKRQGLNVPDKATGSAKRLNIEDGIAMYMDCINKPLVMDGTVESTQKRYRSVFTKFAAFLKRQAVSHWDGVSITVVEKYAKALAESKSHATLYLEITLIKQIVKWLIEENQLPESSKIKIKLRKPNGTTRYCYSKQQVIAILDYCTKPRLLWLRRLVLGLVYIGLRIRELASIRWVNIDFGNRMIKLIDQSQAGPGKDLSNRLLLKNHKSRDLPIHPDMLPVLKEIRDSSKSDYVFANGKGKLIHDGSARRTFTGVLGKVAQKFAHEEWAKEIQLGTFHSFRHYFCTVCCDANVPIQMLMLWLGHHHSSLIERYYHARHDEAKKQMSNVNFLS